MLDRAAPFNAMLWSLNAVQWSLNARSGNLPGLKARVSVPKI